MQILDTLQTLLDTRADAVERWFTARRAEAAPLIYNSVDLRHSGLRLAPVDTNCYPAGFLNLSANAKARAARQLKGYMAHCLPQAKKLLIIPENHTRNQAYLENLVALQHIAEAAGLEVEFGSLAANAGEPIALTAPSGAALVEQPLIRQGGKLLLENGFTPDAILLNNDLTAGAPALLENLTQPVLPPTSMGWWQRQKSTHFAAYHTLAEDFARNFSLDPWLIAANFTACGRIDFKERTGIDALAKKVDCLLTKTRAKYAEYGLTDTPYVFVKADAGTYGMGIMTVQSGEELFEMNKKERNKMQIIKEGAEVHNVIIQEGIPTADTIDTHPAEPMVYLIDGIPIGGMWRVNASRDTTGNLNASGMTFAGMCDESEDDATRHKLEACHAHSYGTIAAIAALAAAREEYAVPVERRACG